MDSDKPSNPSSKSGNSDDLIEEMAKLMGNPSPSAASDSETGSSPQQSAPRPEPEGSDNAASDSGADNSPEPAAPSAPEPVVHSSPAAQSGADDAPGWLPLSNRKPEPQPSAATVEPDSQPKEPERQEPSFALRPQRQEPAGPAETQAPEPASSAGWKPESAPDGNPSRFDFGLTRETPRTPEPEAPQTSATSDYDFGFGSDRSAEPTPEPAAGPNVPEETPAPTSQPAPEAPDEVDPIAALIRDQLKQPAADTAPEPKPAAPSRPAESQPAPASRSDNFNVPPVFGLGGDTSKRSMSGSDALDDIENLIGNAVRVDLPPEAKDAPQAPQQQQPGPVPQPPVRPHQPRQPTPQSNPAGDVDAAEAAILAAMASNNADPTGQQALRAEHPSGPATADFGEADDTRVLTDDEQPRSGIRWGRILMPVAALLLLGAFGFAGYTFLTATPPEGEAPVLVADSDPNKVTPEVDETEDAGDSLVFSDDTESDGSGEQLVSRDQSGDAGSDDAIRQIITADTTENGLANRRVRTVTVRPDGTIVSGDDLVAGSEALSVDRPEVPALPDDAVTSALADTEVAGLTLDEPAADTTADLVDNTLANLVPVNGTSVPFPATRPDNLSALRASVPAQTTPLAITQPSVTATPQSPVVNEQPAAVDLLGDLQDVTPSPTPTAVPASSVESAVPSATDPPPQTVTAAAWVQLASQRDQAVANSEAGRLSRLYSSALAGRAPVVQQADLADRGIWYRVLVPAGSLGEAQNICSQITSIGGDCFARAN